MDATVEQKQISADERAQINRQVKAELIEHLYQGCLPGTISGIPVGIAIFIDFYNHSPTNLLIGWYIFYNLGLAALTALYFIYRKHKNAYSLDTWLMAYSTVMCVCAFSWALSVYLIPDNLTRQYFAFIALFLIATGYATGSIGVFRLCLVTLSIIVIPLIVWCFMKGTTFYNLLGFFSMIYIGFMSGINRRSTEWFKDSLKLKLENTLVSYQANHDVLTGLPNQRLLPQYVDAAIAAIKNTDKTFALACYSLNRMEIIDDSLGHQASNTIIQTMALRLKELIAKLEQDPQNTTSYVLTISRKDSFTLVISPLLPDEAEDKIKILFSALDEHIFLEQKGVKMTASIGVSLYGKDGNDAQTLLANADAAMLRAKHFGGDRLEFYRSEINIHLPKQLELEHDLHIAINENQLVLFYQPLIDVSNMQICGMEALMRWKHPVHGFISPANFIPLAEETGLIVPMGEWALHEACRQTRIWHQMGFSHIKVAVNLAEKQIAHGNFLATVSRVLRETEFDSKYLELEITETSILDESVTNLLKEFKSMGLSLAVDDFGTGYSGLSYLKRFSIDKLKIDQSFVRDIPGNNDSMTIVSAIIAMGKELHVKTLAEGVETVEQLDFLVSKGCNYIQGYYFSKPVDAEIFTQLLYKYRNTAMRPASESVTT